MWQIDGEKDCGLTWGGLGKYHAIITSAIRNITIEFCLGVFNKM